MISVAIEDELLDGLEQFIADRDEPPRGRMTYDDAVNVIVRDWLMSQGYVPLPGEADGITPALEAADVPEA
ncbi:hypothetical protein JI749_13120 [Devosia oryziradicis]|uniref:CopG family transcriptional regulator n=1 Tax=Devosia oryziradicis TaxID=2801335 RepID=A0ABX7BTN1_9HYPH|nr:hypothetical protein [Devosia oryziradicis]QQR35296.1 hypothetical protein JI749_13120 [Devosia oryziradicis]